jgi:hypothetical protein
MQVSWIDAHQVTALAEGLRRSPAKTASIATPEPFSAPLMEVPAAFVDADEPEQSPLVEVPAESESPPPMVDFRARLQAIRDRAISAGLIPAMAPAVAKEAEVELPPFLPKTGAVSERLAAFIDWAQPGLPDAEFFIVDDQGALHWGTPATSGLVLSAIMAWGAASRMSALAACETQEPLRQIMATGRHLAVIPNATRLGLLYVAITTAAPLSGRQILAISHALVAAMDAAD